MDPEKRPEPADLCHALAQDTDPHDTFLYRSRHGVENRFGRFKDWRRGHTDDDRCARTSFSTICIAATVIFWLPQRILRLCSGSECAQQWRSG